MEQTLEELRERRHLVRKQLHLVHWRDLAAEIKTASCEDTGSGAHE